MIKEKDPEESMDASDVYRLSPPDIFEDLLGDPAEKGYDESTLKKKFKNARHFICDTRPPIKDDETTP